MAASGRSHYKAVCFLYLTACRELLLARFYTKPWFLGPKCLLVKKYIPRIWVASFKQRIKDIGFIPAHQLSNCFHQCIFTQSIHRTEFTEKMILTLSFPIGLKILNLKDKSLSSLMKEKGSQDQKDGGELKSPLILSSSCWVTNSLNTCHWPFCRLEQSRSLTELSFLNKIQFFRQIYPCLRKYIQC